MVLTNNTAGPHKYNKNNEQTHDDEDHERDPPPSNEDAHVRRNVDVKLFGRTDGDFANYLRGAWATVKAEQAKVDEEARIAELRRTTSLPTEAMARASFEAGLLAYYGEERRYYGD